MPGIANYSAWIQVDGKALPEYDVQYSDNGTRVSCWIPSEAGKNFIIAYKGRLRDSGVRTIVSVDGVRCGGGVLQGEGSGRQPVKYHRGVSMSDRTYKPYMFSNCQLTDDDGALGLLPGIGEITLVVDEVFIYEHVPWAGNAVTLPPLHVHERAKKGIVHGTQLGEEVYRRPRGQYRNKTIRNLVSFVFKYRPIAVLMADGIAPKEEVNSPRTRKPLVDPEDIIDLTLDGEVHATRKKGSKASKPTNAAVKTERSIKLDGDFIDLTT